MPGLATGPMEDPDPEIWPLAFSEHFPRDPHTHTQGEPLHCARTSRTARYFQTRFPCEEPPYQPLPNTLKIRPP